MTVTRDATSLKYLPASSAEWTAMLAGTGISNPSLLWLCQEASGNLADSIGAAPGIVHASPTYQTTISGWSRKGVTTGSPTTNVAGAFGTNSVPDLSTTSMLTFAVVAYPASNGNPEGDSPVITVGSFNPDAQHGMRSGTDKLTLYTGAPDTVGTAHYASGVWPSILQANHATGTVTLQTSQETISRSYTGTSTFLFLGGDDSNTNASCGVSFLYVANFNAAAAEMTSTQRATLLSLYNTGPVASVAVTPSSATLTTIGATQQLTPTGTYSSGTATITSTTTVAGECTVTYSSSDPTKATVSSSGLVTAVATGSCTITVTFNGVTQTVPITVAAAPTLVSIAVTPSTDTINIGATQQLTATGTYSDSSTANLTTTATWSSSFSSGASVNSTGLVTGVSVSSPYIGATVGSVEGFSHITVVNPVTLTSVTVDQPTVSLPLGSSTLLTATAHFSDSSTLALTTEGSWSSSDSTKVNATGGDTGAITAVGAGTAIITVTYFGVSGTATVNVTAPPAPDVSNNITKLLTALISS